MVEIFDSLRKLESMWKESEKLSREKPSAEGVEAVIEFVESTVNSTLKFLDIVIPRYAELMDKENLTTQEEMELSYIQKILPFIRTSIIATGCLLGAYSPFLPQEKIKELVQKIDDINLFFKEFYEEGGEIEFYEEA